MENKAEETRGENREEKKGGAMKSMKLSPNKDYDAGVRKRHCKNGDNPCSIFPVFFFFYYNILWKNPNKLFGQPNSRKIFSFCVSSLCGDSKMVMIFVSRLYSTVWRKYVRSGTLKARDRENVLENFRNPDHSSVFL